MPSGNAENRSPAANDPWEGTMPRESEPTNRSALSPTPSRLDPSPSRAPQALELTAELRQELLPWVDLAEVGAVGLRTWIATILPLVPRPTPGGDPLDRDVSRGTPSERLTVLAKALAECASDRARAHFQASEYFRENRVLARRVKALEAILRTRVSAGKMGPVDVADPEADAAVRRYIPPERGSSR